MSEALRIMELPGGRSLFNYVQFGIVSLSLLEIIERPSGFGAYIGVPLEHFGLQIEAELFFPAPPYISRPYALLVFIPRFSTPL